MNAKDEGQWWEGEVRVTDDDEHSFGYIYDNRRTPEYDLYELGRDPDPEAIESLVARLNDYDIELNALQQQVTELEGKAEGYEDILLAMDLGMKTAVDELMAKTSFEEVSRKMTAAHLQGVRDAAGAAMAALTSPSTIAQKEMASE